MVKNDEASRKSKPKGRGSVRKVNKDIVGELLVQYFDEISEALGLRGLVIDEGFQRELVREVLELIVHSTTSKPSIDVLLRRIKSNRRSINKFISAKILESTDKFTAEQLNFILSYGEEAVIPFISEIYRELIKSGRSELIDALKYVWEKYGRPTLVQCPKCGFRSIMPDYSCTICGYSVTESYVREQLSFSALFEEYVRTASISDLREVLDAGFVIVSESGIYSPRNKAVSSLKAFYSIYLVGREISLIISEMSSREQEI
ncbi:MAG: hypothetical protein RMI83_06825 [Desulfurococcaceae archaeon]|nr:hypothetical protein [Sulfolobales archaeon]MDW8170794.1 hypothetical protein [Desulfurococcaceae archaeon]